MSLRDALTAFQDNALQCDNLIANAHRADPAGAPLFPAVDRQQITVAAFLNLFVAWEAFLEDSLAQLMTGSRTLSGRIPKRYVSPSTVEAARLLVVGINRYFDYANPENLRKMVNMYFDQGYPFEPHLSGMNTDLFDLRIMRNSSAHITSTTQAALEGLAQRVFSVPRPGIDLYTFLTSLDPVSGGGTTVFAARRQRLLVAAELIVNG